MGDQRIFRRAAAYTRKHIVDVTDSFVFIITYRLRGLLVGCLYCLVVFLDLVVVIACLPKPQNRLPKSTKTAEGLSDTNGKPASDVQEFGRTLLWFSGQKQKN